jgi:hypothetical protein
LNRGRVITSSACRTERAGNTAVILAARLFQTIPKQDRLGFWDDETLNAKKVADFLGFDKDQVARISSVSAASVRFDGKMPKQVEDRLEEIANIAELVAQFFAGDRVKTGRWFRMKNPRLGDVSPRDMIRARKQNRLRRLVLEALKERSPKAEPPRRSRATRKRVRRRR